MEAARPRAFLPGPIRQNGYVVRDLGRAIDGWLAAGVGPWLLLPHMTQTGSVYRGRETAPVVSIAFANSGDLQVELIAQEDDSPSIYREFLDGGRQGFHHLAWWTEDFAAVTRAAGDAGWPVVHAGNAGGMAQFAYYDQGGATSTVVEVMELTDATRWLVATVREAAENWDGSDPVRNLV
ncbi:MAG TPA: VOC family protein [Acidimicrobiales bacterium]|nr:VOC family protein [Acidimicrobiales bacterium]